VRVLKPIPALILWVLGFLWWIGCLWHGSRLWH
jgi:hypothetical protein